MKFFSYLKFTLSRIPTTAHIFSWPIPSGDSVNRNPSGMRKLWWDQKLEIKIDFVFLEDFAMYTLC